MNSAALTDLAVRSHFDYASSYQVSYNFLRKVHQQSLAHKGVGLKELFGNNVDNVFPSVGDSSVPDSSEEVRDLKSAFERIYEAAKRGHRQEAFDFLLKLEEIPHCIGLSALSGTDLDNFEKDKNFLGKVFEEMIKSATAFNTQKRQEILSFLCAYYCTTHKNTTMRFDEFEVRRINLENQIKKHLTDQLEFQKVLSVHTLRQLLFPTFGICLVGFWSILALAYYDDSAKRIGFGISGLVSGVLSALFKWYLDQTKYFWDQTAKWEVLTSENTLQRQADFLAAFFTILEYQGKIAGTFLWQNFVNQAIQEQHGIILRLRQSSPSWMPFHATMQGVEPLEKTVIKNVRSDLKVNNKGEV